MIAVTSYALSGDEDKAKAAGCDDYVTKPFSPRALLGQGPRLARRRLSPAMRDPPLLLIVDDHQDNRDILAARLTSQGYATAQAVDGEDALGPGGGAAARPDPARRDDAQAGRAGGRPAAARRPGAAVHPDHPGHRQDRGRRRGRRPRGRRRRLPDQAGRARRPGRPGALDVADQGAARSGPGPERRARALERHAPAAGRGAGRGDRADRPPAPLPPAPGGRSGRLGGRRAPAGEPSGRGHGAVRRPARLHRVRRADRAGRR